MTRESLISLAFRQFATLIALDEAPEYCTDRDELKAHFARLPWDEKAFKVNDDRMSGADTDASSGNWMARVSKDGPSLILSPTMDVYSKRIVIAGSQFWKRLSAALDHAAPVPSARRAEGETEAAPALALNRWNKFHFAKWTQAPNRSERDKTAASDGAKPSAARQAYSIFYQ